MNKIPVSNNTDMPIYVGAAMVLPGETRHFEEHEVPHHLRPAQADAPVEQTPSDPLAELLAGSVSFVNAALPGLSTAEIEQMSDLEQQGKARKGILSAIADLLLTRAANADLLAKAAALTDEELSAALESATTGGDVDPDYVAVLEAEAAKRNPGAAE